MQQIKQWSFRGKLIRRRVFLYFSLSGKFWSCIISNELDKGKCVIIHHVFHLKSDRQPKGKSLFSNNKKMEGGDMIITLEMCICKESLKFYVNDGTLSSNVGTLVNAIPRLLICAYKQNIWIFIIDPNICEIFVINLPKF